MKKTRISILSIAAVFVLSSCNSTQPNNDSNASKQDAGNNYFTLKTPTNLSSMSDNCKQYVDDMRAQQQKLIAEKGADADYYINDLYGTNGVDLTKGVLPSTGNYQDNTGGYRDGTTENDYLDPVGADWEKVKRAMKVKVLKYPLSLLMI